MIQSRELGFVSQRPVGAPLLRLGFEGPAEPVGWLFQVAHSIAQRIARLLRGERGHGGRGSIAFYSASVHIRREPVRQLGEVGLQESDLAYGDVTRLEFVPPDRVIVGFGPATRGLNQQAVLTLAPLTAQDEFDSIVVLMEERDPHHLYSVLDGGNLSHSRPWTWEERFPNFGLVDEVTVYLQEVGIQWRWKLVTGEDEEFDVVESHGLVLTAAAEPERALMQAFTSQVIDGSGLALALIDRSGRGLGFSTSRDERFWIDPDGDVRLGAEIVGSFPVDVDPSSGPDTIAVQFGSTPRVVMDPYAPKTLSLTRPLPKAWALALSMITLLPARPSIVA